MASVAPLGLEREEGEGVGLRVRLVRAALGLGAGTAVAGGAAWCLGARSHDVLAHIRNVRPWMVFGSIASALVVLALQSLRWHLVMGPLLGLRYAQAYRAQIVGVAFNALLPARGGDLLRVQYLGRRTGVNRATIFGTEVVDRWLDWWGWFPVLLVLAAVTHLPSWLYGALPPFALVLGGWATVMVLASRRGYSSMPVSRLRGALRSFRTGVGAFRSRRTLLIALAVAPLPWLWETAALVLVGHSFGIQLSLAMAFSVLVGFNVAMIVPSPGAIGSVEAGGMAALVFFGVDQSKALAFMFVYHFTQLLPPIAAGVAILVFEGEWLLGRPRIRESQTTPPAAVTGTHCTTR